MTMAKSEAKAAHKVTQPKPRPLSTHTSSDEVARMPGTGARGPWAMPGSRASRPHPHAPVPPRTPLSPVGYLLCGW